MKKTDTTRKCIVTGNILEKDKLLRFCVGPDNEIIPDFKKKTLSKLGIPGNFIISIINEEHYTLH